MLNETNEERDERFMLMALDEARVAAEEGEVPVGAVVVCNGRVIARTHNLTERLRDVTAHAEMQAITAAADNLNGKYLTDCTIYVTLEPCPMCAAALRWAQIGRVVYGASDPKQGYRTAFADPDRAFHPKTEVTTGIIADECREVMQSFFRRRR
ncbi:MAG: nucleoside deaminase [Muribaculaceae bacterium]|nr:nucleoside deaminase [Muribaculaceae bacterium]MDE6558585.1 nucleoside deaminase [Muribaculaceae bacterium]